jgi:hypothetical protein
VETSKIQLKWTERLGEDLGNNRYGFYAELTPRPDESWRKCFREVAELFRKSEPFDAEVDDKPGVIHAAVFGRLEEFENKLSVELEAAVSQTNDAYRNFMERQVVEKKQAEARRAEEDRIREDLKKKFVKK